MRMLKLTGVAIVSALAGGLIVYLVMISPLEQRLVEEKTRSLAQQVEAIIEVRASSLWAVTSVLDIDNLRPDNNVTNSMNALRQRCADFLSLELLDEQGEILAMLGDVPLSEAGRRGTVEDVAGLKSQGSSVNEWFTADQASSCFYVTTKQIAPDGKMWFARARFAR